MLDLKAAAQLQQQFIERQGSPLVVDASQVERIGGLCLQVLLAAQAAWAAERHSFLFTDGSDELQANLATFGVPVPALSFQEE